MARTVTTTITDTATRKGTSYLGNPRYTLHTTDGDFKTRENTGCAYEATNFRTGDRVELELTAAGTVWSIRKA